jgi:hypothetical protein
MTIGVDAMLWKPKPGATASADEFIRARSLIMDIHESEQWNPWARGDLAAEYEAAIAIFGQWTRAEPGFRQKTREEFEAEHEQCRVGLDASIKADSARREQEHSPGPASPPPPPKPEPLAVIASGMPIGEVISQLTAAQAAHPGAKVRRGNRNRRAIWPA